jgi:hypothetical protein
MKNERLKSFIATAIGLALVVTTVTGRAQTQTTDMPKSIITPDRVESRLGTLTFKDGIPDPATAQKLFDEIDGVELGQLLFIASVFLAMAIARRTMGRFAVAQPAWAWRVSPVRHWQCRDVLGDPATRGFLNGSNKTAQL